MVQALITLPAGARVVAHLRSLTATRPGGRPLSVGRSMAHAVGIGADLHFVLTRGTNDPRFGLFSAAFGSNAAKVSTFDEGGVQFKRDRTLPARRPRLGAVDGGGGTTRIAGVTCNVDQGGCRRSQDRLEALRSEVGDLTSVGKDDMGIFIIFLTEGGVRDFSRHDFWKGGQGKARP